MTSFHVHGPLSGDCCGTRLLDEIGDFRRGRYASCSPHLVSSEVKACEQRLRLDERGTHFLIRDPRARLVGAVRLCPAPFEMTELAEELASADATFSSCFEIGRLVCERQTGDPLLAARLLAAAGEWAAERPGCGGLIAVCSRLRTRVFRRYGMHPVNDNSLLLKGRPSAPYLLLHGDFQTLRDAMRGTLSAADPHALATRPLAA